MTVGVIVTVYNLDKYVAEAIESILGQSFQPSRIIVVNDGSTDNSRAVIDQYKDRVEVIDNEKNLGVLPSVVAAMKHLDTDVVALLDGDDRWSKDKLQAVMDCFRKEPDAMIVVHSYNVINEAGALVPGSDKSRRNLESIVRKTGNDLAAADILLKESILSYRGVWLGSALSIKRNCVDIEKFETWSKGFWGHHLSHQDQPLAAYMILINPGKIIRYLDQACFDYRIFGENSSGASSTIEKATRTLARSKATLIRTQAAVASMPNRRVETTRQANKLLEVEYLERLYSRKYLAVIKPFFRLFLKHWDSNEKLKELSRVAGTVLLGPSRFLKIK